MDLELVDPRALEHRAPDALHPCPDLGEGQDAVLGAGGGGRKGDGGEEHGGAGSKGHRTSMLGFALGGVNALRESLTGGRSGR